jgi:hypothetical protein
MIKRLLGTAVVLGVAYMVASSLPDLARYIKMRRM